MARAAPAVSPKSKRASPCPSPPSDFGPVCPASRVRCQPRGLGVRVAQNSPIALRGTQFEGTKRMAVSPTTRPTIAAEAFLRALADHGTDYFFANPGTDFPPIVEAFSRAKQSNAKVPTPLVIPHESLAVAMAHGAYAMSGKPQAVMLHVNVGTANAIANVINLNRDNVPLILAAGRT